MSTEPIAAATPATPATDVQQRTSDAGARPDTGRNKGAAGIPHASLQDYPNPSLRLDAGLGLVVIEFRDSSGVVTRTIPSAQQIAAYRQWAATGVGQDPLPGSAPIGSAPDGPPPMAGVPMPPEPAAPGSVMPGVTAPRDPTPPTLRDT